MTTATLGRPAVPASTARSRVGLGATLSQTWLMAGRALLAMRRSPEQFVDVTVQPLLFTAMFTYIFGGAISGSVRDYLPIIIPGILAQTTITACMATGVQLREDMDKGVFDRFRSLPMARIAPLAGSALADTVRFAIAGVLTVLTGIAMGFRPGGGVVGTVAAILLGIASGWCLAWIFTFIGTIAKSARAVQGISMLFLFPLTFLSNAFVPAQTLPGWLQAFVKVNPVSHIISAVRALMNTGTVTSEVWWALLGIGAVAAVFIPLSVWSYTRK